MQQGKYREAADSGRSLPATSDTISCLAACCCHRRPNHALTPATNTALPPCVQAPGKLCATPYGVDIVGITEFILLVGAFVGGAVARQRKQEMEKLNDQLRTINISLRQQARSGTVYAPGARNHWFSFVEVLLRICVASVCVCVVHA